MLVQEGVFEDISIDVTTCDMVANFVVGRRKVPLCCSAKSIGVDTSWNIDGLG
jgi:hypothetical protein